MIKNYIALTILGFSTLGVFNAQEKKQDSINKQQLKEVVVTASREKQERKEVAAAISSISSKEIEQTKAVGLEQLVNNVPGVYMATSKAASNEQHFMASRSPISTKALFLFVEDGLPIRPTAVFNHNALLEINQLAIDKIEVVRGAASNIYGSEAIGGSFNFITKSPTEELTGSAQFEGSDLGIFGTGIELAQQVTDKFGFYSGTSYKHRNNGPIEYSNYRKFATTFKGVYDFSSRLTWTNTIDLIDYKSDMTGSLSEDNYLDGNYESNQTFTNRIAKSFRLRSSLDKKWNNMHKTAFHFIFRNNKMDQNPSYRIRQFRNSGQLTGFGSGEVNENHFNSYMALVQHKINLNFLNAKLIIGASADFSPQSYEANSTNIIVNPLTGINESFTINETDYLLNYEADIFNTASYAQFEFKPIDKLHITAGLRYDNFSYDYDNKIENTAGVNDAKTSYKNLSPKIGANYNFNNTFGVYANIANGFSPPQVSSLYRNSLTNTNNEVFNLKPSSFYNYEVGTYFKVNNKVKADIAVYVLDGKDRLVTTSDNANGFVSKNAGKTRSYGIEYGITYQPINELTLSHNGSFSQHKYIEFYNKEGFGSNTQIVDYSDTDMQVAPNLVGTTRLHYTPKFIKNFGFTAEYELMGKYNMSFENEVDTGSTDINGNAIKTTNVYDGHHVFNLRASYKYKKVELWTQVLNVFDELYSIRASYSYGRNRYSIGNPRGIHAGIKLSL
ncbi:TonB-dependent receptor [Pseudofulvibacter geojedonensis]|uniref:TonB-dependent receptor n=1 Tax=Pseudofulvibacter geojedonensis TaxID=1123758 RepID=A0ABW3HYU7_9FLAO